MEFKMDRAEHLEWCKKRALEYCDAGDWQNAWASMASDMSKHPETKNHSAIALGMTMVLAGHINSASKMEKFINGFN